jgi:hypothetical protein
MATDYQSVFVNELLYIIFISIKLLRTKETLGMYHIRNKQQYIHYHIQR